MPIAVRKEYADLKTQRKAEYDTLKATGAEVPELQKSANAGYCTRADQPNRYRPAPSGTNRAIKERTGKLLCLSVLNVFPDKMDAIDSILKTNLVSSSLNPGGHLCS